MKNNKSYSNLIFSRYIILKSYKNLTQSILFLRQEEVVYIYIYGVEELKKVNKCILKFVVYLINYIFFILDLKLEIKGVN